ncbi:MAG: response regulator, partial [Caldilineae bacterium]
LYKQVENRLKRRELLNRLARRLSSKLSLEALALDIMQTAAVISNADAAAVVLVDPSNESRFLQFTHNLPGEPLPTHTGQLPAMAKQAFEKQQVVASNRFGEEAHASPPWLPVDIKGAVAIPLSTGDRPLGVLGLFTFERPFSQSHEVLNTLEAIGRQAGVAIENAMLFQRINEYAITLEERVRARTEEIRRQQEQTEAILAGAADAIFITAADGTIEYANPAFTALTGYLPEEVIGQNPRLLKSGQTPPATYRDMWRTILDGKVWRGTLKNRRQDGSLYDADLTIAPIFNQEGRIEKFVAIQRDISKLTELDRLKTEFLGTAAHELRGPLTTIRGYTELLLARGDTFSPKESKKFLGYIHEQAVHLATLVSDLLDLSKIESGSAFAITPETINPRSIFQQAVAHWQTQTTIHTIRLVEPETWPSVEVDPARLKQTLNNLLSNAIKYSPQGGEIAVTVTVTPSSLRVSVSDEGIGMTLEEQKHIFEKFWRADASSTAVEGTGLGMVIVKHIIEAHGGKIWVSSRKGEGTTVSFTLPLTTGVATILIIEDESSIVEVEERLLAMEGYHILTAPNGREGLELARQHQPDLIILDLMMEGMSGETVLKKLKADPVTQSIPVVVVSAKSALLNIENAFALGAADFMVKPFNVNEFLGRIKIALSK